MSGDESAQGPCRVVTIGARLFQVCFVMILVLFRSACSSQGARVLPCPPFYIGHAFIQLAPAHAKSTILEKRQGDLPHSHSLPW